ncbi:MAG: hypothetical protein KC438_06185 [Thermomicrobiales bacterium]|nr:hypothetical protein [Thermomicrobiales bacterium]
MLPSLCWRLDQDPGTTASAIIDLAPGTWSVVLTSDGAEVAEPVLQLTAAGEVPDGATDSIPTDLVVNLGEYVFDFPDNLPAGPQIWQLTNSHTVPHHLILFGADRLYTADEITGGLAALFMGTPPAEDGFVPAAFVLGTSLISGGVSTWIEADLEPGYYVAICFLPDPGGEDPHAFMGMVDSFEVTA